MCLQIFCKLNFSGSESLLQEKSFLICSELVKVNILVTSFDWQEQWNLALWTKWIVIRLKYSVDIFYGDVTCVSAFLLLCLAIFIIFIRFHFRSPWWLHYYLKMRLSIFPLSQVTLSEWLISLGNHKMIMKFTLSIQIHMQTLFPCVSANLSEVIFFFWRLKTFIHEDAKTISCLPYPSFFSSSL